MEFVTAPPQRPAMAPRETVEWTQAWTGKPSGATLAPRFGADCRAYKVADFEPGSPEWHALRAGRIGGSDAGVLLGVGFRSWDELIVEKATPREPEPPTMALKRGTWFESAVLAYAADRGYVADPTMHGSYLNPDYPNFAVNPDAVTIDRDCVIEAKTTNWRDPSKWGKGGSDRIPLSYRCQVNLQCAFLGIRHWVLPVIATKPRRAADGTLSSEWDFALYRGTFDPSLFTALVEKAERFMEDLEAYKLNLKVSQPA